MKALSLLALVPCLLHCGPTLPVSATVVSCADQRPIADAQVSTQTGNTSRTHADGTWSWSLQGGGSLPVTIIHKGYEKKKVSLHSGTDNQLVCLTPDAK